MIFKLGLDFHGVVDSLSSEFKLLSKLLVDSGNEVHIITGGSWTKELEEDLKEYGISWTHSFSVYDYLLEVGTPITGQYKFTDGTVQNRFVDGHWDRIKGEYCKKHNISLHLDDTLIYNDFFTTPFARVWTHNGKEKSTKKDIRHLD